MAFDENRGTKEPLNMRICRDELLKYLTGSLKGDIVVCIACFFAALAVTILVTADAISEINDIEVFDFFAFCHCALLLFLVVGCAFFVVGPFLTLLLPTYLDLRRVRNGQFRVVKDVVYETGRTYISGRYGRYLHKYVEFEHFGKWLGGVELAERGDTYYILLFQKRKKEKIFCIYSTKTYSWDDAQNPIDE